MATLNRETGGLIPLLVLWIGRTLGASRTVAANFSDVRYIARLKETRYLLVPLAVVFIPAALIRLKDQGVGSGS